MTDSVTYYDSIAQGYNQLYQNEQIQKLRTSQLKLPSTWDITLIQSCVDIGCGTGISTDFWSAVLEIRCVGIDPSQKLLDQNTSDKSDLSLGFAEKLPYSDRSFDMVVSFSAIQNFSDILQGLTEIRRVGKHYFILSVLNRGNTYQRISQEIHSQFHVVKTVDCLNDTIFYCEKRDFS